MSISWKQLRLEKPVAWIAQWRSRDPDHTSKVDALRALAGAVRAGAPLRAALIGWPDSAPQEVRDFLEGTARRAFLGAPLPDALASCAELFGSDHEALLAAARLHLICGADAASMIESVAEEITRREVGNGDARAQAAGAKLSARLVGGLPLALLPLMPPGKVDLFDPMGLALLVSGLALAIGGMRWLSRLLPEPPQSDDLGASTAGLIARFLQAGSDTASALQIASGSGPGASTGNPSSLLQAARRVRLGLPARRALLLSDDDGLRAVGRCLELAHHSGAPPVQSLLALVETRRAEQQRRFEEEMRRAPVKMVVPLTLCVLPSFALLGLAPFLRGVTFSA